MSTASFSDPRILPSEEIVSSLISLYYEHVWPWAPIIPRATFSAPWGIVPHAMVVLALRLSDDPRLDRLPGGKHALRAAAKAHVLSHAVESTSIASMQALALLALDLIGSEQGPSSWGTLALLTRSAAHLGLMTEDAEGPPPAPRPPPPKSGAGWRQGEVKRRGVQKRTAIVPPPSTWEEDEARRRLFWLVLVLDRYASASTGWDFALRDGDIRRRLPSSDALWLSPPPGGVWPRAPFFAPVLHRDPFPPSVLATLSPMVFLIEASDLLGRSHSLHSGGPNGAGSATAENPDAARDAALALTAACRRWAAELPRLEGSLGLTVLALHHATLLKINAYHAFPASGGIVSPFHDRCMESTTAMADLCARHNGLGWKSASPLFIWSAWVAARVVFISRFVSAVCGTDPPHPTNSRPGFPHSTASHPADIGSGHAEAGVARTSSGHSSDGPGPSRELGQSGPASAITSDPEFSVLLSSLRQASRHWSLASQYVRLLDAAARRWAAGHVGPLPARMPLPTEDSDDDALPDAIRVLLDLRRTAYNAVGAEAGDATPEEVGERSQRGSLGERSERSEGGRLEQRQVQAQGGHGAGGAHGEVGYQAMQGMEGVEGMEGMDLR